MFYPGRPSCNTGAATRGRGSGGGWGSGGARTTTIHIASDVVPLATWIAETTSSSSIVVYHTVKQRT